jgi:hypothetical protein
MNDLPLPAQHYDFASVLPPRIEFAFRIRIFFKQRIASRRDPGRRV